MSRKRRELIPGVTPCTCCGEPCTPTPGNQRARKWVCTACVAARNKRWREENTERAREDGRRWREENADRKREYDRRWRENNTERERETKRRWRESNIKRVRERKREQMRRLRNDNPDYLRKDKARKAVSRAIARGDLVRQPCEVCGTTKNIEAHHPDHDRPLDVRWLCRKHHVELHNRERAAKPAQQSKTTTSPGADAPLTHGRLPVLPARPLAGGVIHIPMLAHGAGEALR